MEVSLLRHGILSRLSRLVWRFSLSPQPTTPTPTNDAFHEEICRIERIVNDMATCPNRRVREAEPREMLTDPQRIIDLAG